MPRVPIWLGITVMSLCIATFIYIAMDDAKSPRSKDPRTAREKRIEAETNREQDALNRAVQDELIRIEQKN